MTRRQRWAALLLAWYVAIGLALPQVDGALFHREASHATVHVERAGDPDCHVERCSLISTAAPQHRSVVPVSTAAVLPARDEAPRVTVPPRPRHAHLAGPLGPRAPPPLT